MNNNDKNFLKLSESLGLKFKDLELFKQALTHRSYLNEHKDWPLPHNERLEFLGDAVLELVVTDYLYHKYESRTEGELTAFRAALVNTQSLAETADQMGLDDYLLLSKGEAKDIGRARHYILANTFEAVIGSVYLDQGYDTVQELIKRYLLIKTDKMVAGGLWQDAKSLFQEKAQEVTGITPAYEVISETGPDHNKKFTVALKLGDEEVSVGEGFSKQAAEQQAATGGLQAKKWLD
ncbi:MAG: ribonuclease III [Patescibacteria group bacterium]